MADPALRRAERAIVRALRDGGFGAQSQVTRDDGFEIATDDVLVRVTASLTDGHDSDFTRTVTAWAVNPRLGFVTCRECGAAVLVDEDGDVDALALHRGWHLRTEERFDYLLRGPDDDG